ncbi:hypothetical protein SVAN01_02615 [Stagonosporopsis vannaccii]|nr:hypothetical protein SVAN01_02615 [Stagonosporopsis vannaccii]
MASCNQADAWDSPHNSELGEVAAVMKGVERGGGRPTVATPAELRWVFASSLAGCRLGAKWKAIMTEACRAGRQPIIGHGTVAAMVAERPSMWVETLRVRSQKVLSTWIQSYLAANAAPAEYLPSSQQAHSGMPVMHKGAACTRAQLATVRPAPSWCKSWQAMEQPGERLLSTSGQTPLTGPDPSRCPCGCASHQYDSVAFTTPKR